MTTLSNDFHNRTTRTRKTWDELEDILYRQFSGTATRAELALIRRIKRALCPPGGCECGDTLGRRGPQP